MELLYRLDTIASSRANLHRSDTESRLRLGRVHDPTKKDRPVAEALGVSPRVGLLLFDLGKSCGKYTVYSPRGQMCTLAT